MTYWLNRTEGEWASSLNKERSARRAGISGRKEKQPLALRTTVVILGASQVALVVKNPPASAGDTRDPDSIPASGRSPGGGHGNPLQYSCLENPMDRVAWQAKSMGSQRVGHNWSDWARCDFTDSSAWLLSLQKGEQDFHFWQRCKMTFKIKLT